MRPVSPSAVPPSTSTGPAAPAPTALDVVAGHDLTGRTAVVTGGASGIGLETARALALAGARVVIGARDPRTAGAVAAGLRKGTGNPAVTVAALDLGSLHSVREFADGLLRRRDPVHLLIANAGVMGVPPGRTVDGFETHLGVNHLGHFALAVRLLPALRSAGHARVVVVGSSAHHLGGLDLDDPHFAHRPYDPYLAYAQSKTANALFAVALTGRHREHGVLANTVSPGATLTGLQRHLSTETKRAVGLIGPDGTPDPRLRTAAQGAATSVWAAVAPELAETGGAYLEDCAVAGPWQGTAPARGYLPAALDPERADRLWELSAALVGADRPRPTRTPLNQPTAGPHPDRAAPGVR
ncbi:SDR family NAD(P)-dependent oxidoreductase [Kitasatospora sp. NPDC085464]|uniref:SDR family NAD(P)-dependent oxidoreductase n=1 Tax=Kitasatospora sp. NPDC085464 TaxID=3364063 RepID=UPI0037CB9404